MDKVIERAKELRQEIDQLPEFQEYYHLKKQVESDTELREMKKEIVRLEVQGLKEEKKNLEAIYNSHPLINNLEASKESIREILEMLKNILSE